MQLVNSTMNKTVAVFAILICLQFNSLAQGNSPFSRYGIGDLVNTSNILNRGMGGVGIGVKSDRFLNNSNPASYSWIGEPLKLKNLGADLGKLVSFEVGSEFYNSNIKQKTPLNKFSTNNLIFNSMQLGMQLSKKGNWGVCIGLLPVSRENYDIINFKRITNIDSAITSYSGNGGSYKGQIGTAYRKGNFSFGINSGYFFGRKTTTTEVELINDSILYFQSQSNNKLNFGSAFLQTGILYTKNLVATNDKLETVHFGATYELQNKMKSSEDIERLTFNKNFSSPISATDSVYIRNNVSGKVIMPSSLGLGFSYKNLNKKLNSSFVFGIDYTATAWNNFRINGLADQVQNNFLVKGGIEFKPATIEKNYWSKVNYRTGFYYGKDYVKAGGNMPLSAFTIGLGMPVPNRGKVGLNSAYINMALEVGKRGNNANNVTENFVKLALSVSLADIWFVKRKYD